MWKTFLGRALMWDIVMRSHLFNDVGQVFPKMVLMPLKVKTSRFCVHALHVNGFNLRVLGYIQLFKDIQNYVVWVQY
jgi:hypothetical protein